MNRVFIDASFWVAYREEEDARRALAQRLVMELCRQHVLFVTTLPVICEIHAVFSRNPLKRAMVLGDFYDNPLVTIEEVSHRDQSAARQLLSLNKDKTYSLCDVISFIVMRRLGITRAASFDRHFHQFGEFDILPEKI
ncbi:MAG TPA: PIN domain-containing protein [Verrucomicrobiae bacterium]|jgi:predicted nucleic acid-binding protein